MTVRGIDISAAQGTISPADWAKLATAGVRFVYVEAGVGNDPKSDNLWFDRYVADARAAGLDVGAYSFLYPLPEDPAHPGRSPEDQAQRFFEVCHGLGSRAGELPHAIDVEWPCPGDGWTKWGVDAALVNDSTRRCLDKLDALFGRPSLVYTYPDFANHARFGPEVGSRRLWIASYQASPVIPVPWGSCVMQQVTGGGGRLPSGVPVDQDVVDDAVYAELLR